MSQVNDVLYGALGKAILSKLNVDEVATKILPKVVAEIEKTFARDFGESFRDAMYEYMDDLAADISQELVDILQKKILVNLKKDFGIK